MKPERSIFLVRASHWCVAALLLLAQGLAVHGATTVTQVSCGVDQTLFLKSDGSVWGMGRNDLGQLGDGTMSNRFVPVLIIPSNVVAIAAGGFHSLFLKSDGNLWATGLNNAGQLGDGTNIDKSQPEQITFNGGVTAIAAGIYHSLFLKANEMWGMGQNSSGALGNNSNGAVFSPILLRSGVALMAGGEGYSVFSTTDGSLWATGGNSLGELGDGSGQIKYAPVEVVTNHSVFTGVIGLAAGETHTLVLEIIPGQATRSLWGAGDNYSGDLGNGNTNVQYKLVEILPSGVSAIATGGNHSMLIESGGSLWCMGGNTHGELGDGSLTEQHVPEQIVASNVTAIAAGYYHSMFIKSDGSLWAMGDNQWGQLGDGTGLDSYLPERIVPPRELVITNVSLSGTSLLLKGLNEFGSGSVIVLMSTDVTVPIGSWMPVSTNGIVSGNFSLNINNVVDPPAAKRFYRLRLLQIL